MPGGERQTSGQIRRQQAADTLMHTPIRFLDRVDWLNRVLYAAPFRATGNDAAAESPGYRTKARLR